MDKYLREAIESLLSESHRCSADNHGFIQGFPMEAIAALQLQYDKDCRKHGRRVIRPAKA
jgi:hypothetical protein